MPRDVLLLDGPLGSELEARGAACPAPAWTSAALAAAPNTVRAIAADYARAGADVHTAATFRTHERSLRGTPLEGRWRELTRLAVALAQLGARDGGDPAPRVAGSLAPLEDCYRPDRTPDDDALAAEHAQAAGLLAAAGADLVLVETMPTVRELVAATRAAVATGLPVWSALTLGPSLDFFTRADVVAARRIVGDLGAEAFLVNCTPADVVTDLVAALADDDATLPFGAYGNAIFDGHTDWPVERYVDEVAAWVDAGASIVGGCCGTTPAHVRALRSRWPRRSPSPDRPG